jgi:hypothetical protein
VDSLDLKAILTLSQQNIILLLTLLIMLFASLSAVCQQAQLMEDSEHGLSFNYLLPHGFDYLFDDFIKLLDFVLL